MPQVRVPTRTTIVPYHWTHYSTGTLLRAYFPSIKNQNDREVGMYLTGRNVGSGDRCLINLEDGKIFGLNHPIISNMLFIEVPSNTEVILIQE